MNFVEKWFIRKCKWAWDNFRYLDQEEKMSLGQGQVKAATTGVSIAGKSSVRFNVYPASGGWVIEHYKQDRFKESEGPQLTIVTDSDKLGEALAHIVTLEALKS